MLNPILSHDVPLRSGVDGVESVRPLMIHYIYSNRSRSWPRPIVQKEREGVKQAKRTTKVDMTSDGRIKVSPGPQAIPHRSHLAPAICREERQVDPRDRDGLESGRGKT
jgi:hypothetical protein